MHLDNLIKACMLCGMLLLVGCKTTQPNTSAVQPFHKPLSIEIASTTNALLVNHPALHFKHIQLVQRTGNGDHTGSDMLSRIYDSLNSNNPFEINWLTAERSIAECDGFEPDYYLVIDFESNHQVTLSFMQQHLAPLTPSVQRTVDFYLGQTEQNWINQRLTSFSNRNRIYSFSEPEQIAEGIANQIACLIHFGAFADLTFHVSTENSQLTPLVKIVEQQLAQHQFPVKVGNQSHSNSGLYLTLLPTNDDNLATLMALSTNANGEPIAELSAELLVGLAYLPSPIEAEAQLSEQVIDTLFAVAPTDFNQCYKTNSWQYGEQVLPDAVKLPHQGCFAIKASLQRRANFALLAETSEGYLVNLLAGQCQQRQSPTQFSFPVDYAKEQLVLELNEQPGTETFVLVATEYTWSDAMQTMLKTIPSVCDGVEQRTSVRLSDLVNQAKREQLDIAKRVIVH